MIKRDKVYIVSHSGIYAGNLVRNTLPAFEAALLQGADVLEVDIAKSSDGTLVLFHEGYEKHFFKKDVSIRNLTLEEIKNLTYYNLAACPMNQKVDLFDDFLEQFKNRCLINLDKSWLNTKEIAEAVKRHNMQDQVIFKSEVNLNYLEAIKAYSDKMMYMPIIYSFDESLDAIDRKEINVAGVEVVFRTENGNITVEEGIDRFHKQDMFVWGNAIIYADSDQLASGHNDDISIVGREDEGWGYFVDKGFDMIQTDFPINLKLYLEKRKAR